MKYKPYLLDNHEILKVQRLPGRLSAEQAACLLGFQPHDMPVLVQAGIIKPLGSPVLNAPKHFAAVTILRIVEKEEILHRATKAMYQHWKTKNAKRADSKTDEGV